jgi:DNA-binding response OmpR family regulator
MRDGRLLIVEDNPTIAAAIEQAGERLAMQCDIATDGWEAIALLRDEDYHAIVINADLPRQSGYGVLSYLREENGDRLDHVIVMGADDAQVRQRVSGGVRIMRTTSEVAELERAVSSATAVVE